MYEFKVVPAPRRGLKGKGVKGADGRFAHALEALMNELGAEGWDYVRADTLPMDERSGLTGKTTSFQSVLVFRRAVVAAEAEAPAGLIEDHSGDAAPEDAVDDAAVEEVFEAAPEVEDAPDAERAREAAT